MSQFMFIYHYPVDRFGTMSPEDMQVILGKWQAWIQEGVQKRWMITVGDALKKQGRVVDAARMVSDGPFVEVKELVGGFSIVQADDLDAAAVIAKGCPCLLNGGRVEVRELQGYGAKH